MADTSTGSLINRPFERMEIFLKGSSPHAERSYILVMSLLLSLLILGWSAYFASSGAPGPFEHVSEPGATKTTFRVAAGKTDDITVDPETRVSTTVTDSSR